VAKRFRRPLREEAPPAHPLIGFSEPVRAAGDHLIRVLLDPESKRWYIEEAPATEVIAEAGGDLPPDLDYRFAGIMEALDAALKLTPSRGHSFKIVRDQASGRFGFYEGPRGQDSPAEGEVLASFNTVVDATRAALTHVRPWWNDSRTLLLIDGGVTLPNMPTNVRIIHDAGFRSGIDASLYDLDVEGLRAIHERTRQGGGIQARQAAIRFDIPIGQQVHAAHVLYEELWPRHRRRGDPTAPTRNEFLDEVIPVQRRRRERHLKAFLIVSSEEWPHIEANAGIEITGIDSIMKAARIVFPPKTRNKKPKTPLKERYAALRAALLARRYEEGRRQALAFDEEDDEDAEPGSYREENERQ
jgi:hypothetical protein